MFSYVAQAIADYRHTGTFLPSTPAFSRLLAESAARVTPPRRILEVGPGSGPVTKEIVRVLGPGDHFDVVEISARFARIVERECLQPAREQTPGLTIRLFCASIDDVDLEGPYDLIVSSIPFNNFPPDWVAGLLERYEALLKKPDGELRFWEYSGIRRIGRVVSGSSKRRNIAGITRFYREFDGRPEVRKQIFLRNVPPTTVRVVRPSVNGVGAHSDGQLLRQSEPAR